MSQYVGKDPHSKVLEQGTFETNQIVNISNQYEKATPVGVWEKLNIVDYGCDKLKSR